MSPPNIRRDTRLPWGQFLCSQTTHEPHGQDSHLMPSRSARRIPRALQKMRLLLSESLDQLLRAKTEIELSHELDPGGSMQVDRREATYAAAAVALLNAQQHLKNGRSILSAAQLAALQRQEKEPDSPSACYSVTIRSFNRDP